MIGTGDSDKVDSFDVVVRTPSWLSENFNDPRLRSWAWEPPGVRFGNRFLFMQSWDYNTLRTAVTDLCAYWEGHDRGTLANRIGRHIPWEFEEHYDPFVDGTASERPPFPPADQPWESLLLC